MAEVEVKSTSGDVKVITNNAVVSDSLLEQGSGKLSLQLKDPNRVSGSGALGERSVAFGYNTKASVLRSYTEGYKNTSAGDQSHTEGYRNTANGSNSHAEGNNNTVHGNIAHAEGQANVIGEYGVDGSTKGYKSHAEGQGNTVTGNCAHAEGLSNTIIGNNAHVEGQANTVAGVNAHAEGQGNTVTGNFAHAEGLSNTIIGNNAHVEGQSNTVAGVNAHAEGKSNKAIGLHAHAEGQETLAMGQNSHTEGLQTKASGNKSHAEGYGTITEHDSEHACGMFNKTNYLAGQSETIFSIGIGSSDTDRKNAVEVLKDGRVLVYGVGGYNGTNPFTGGKSLGSLIGDANFGGIVCLTLGGELSTAEVQQIISTLADIVNNQKHYILTVYDTVSKQFLGDCEVVKSGTNQYTITSNYTTTTLTTYTLYYAFKTDTNTYTRNLYSVKIASENSVKALEERIAALEGA